MIRPLQSIESPMCVTKAVLLLLLLFAIAEAQDTTPISALEVRYRKQIFKNDGFSVYLLEIPPNHASAMHRHDTDLLSIFVSGGETKSTIYNKPPKTDTIFIGEVRFRPAGFTHSTENIGATMFRSVILEFPLSVGAIQTTKPPDSRYCDPDSGTACVDERYLFCTDKFCVLELSITPGAVWNANECEGDQLLVAVSDYKLSNEPKGKVANVLKRKSGEVEYFPRDAARQWKNVTTEPARIVVVVFR